MTITEITKDQNNLFILHQWLEIIQQWQNIADAALTYEKATEAHQMVAKYTKTYEQDLAKFLLTKTELI